MRIQTMTTAGLTALLMTGAAMAATTQLGPSIYRVDAGVDFELSNSGANSYLFSWSDSSGTFTDIEDPTLLLTVGQTYTFTRVTSAHPFVICDDTLPVTGTDGAYQRTTTDGAVIDAATLDPIDDFTADPAPTSDFITWTPAAGDEGDYFYTCRVTSHVGMAGAIEIEPGPATCDEDLSGDGVVDTDDLFALLGAWGPCPGCPEDLSGDDVIDTDDLFAMLGAWGPCP